MIEGLNCFNDLLDYVKALAHARALMLKGVMIKIILDILISLDYYSFKEDIDNSRYFIDDENAEFYFMNYLRCISFIKSDVISMLDNNYSDEFIFDYIEQYKSDALMLYNLDIAMYSIEKGYLNE